MLNPKTIKTVSDVRENPLGVIRAAQQLGEPIYVFNRARPAGVVMDLAQYQRIREIMEDYDDATLIKDTLEDPDASWIPWKDMKKDLKQNHKNQA